jgi:superfamily II DNA or RNA helicase
VLPTGNGKTFLGLQAIADASVSTLVVTPTTGLTNQWHATLTNAFGDQFSEPIGVSRLTSTNRQYSAIISSRISITETHRRSPLSICCVSNHHSL